MTEAADRLDAVPCMAALLPGRRWRWPRWPCPRAAHATLPAVVNGRPVPSLAPMLKQVTPAVVNISSKTLVRERSPFFDDPVLRQFFGSPPPRERVEQSLGSGVIVDAAKGYVLTNNHVIAGADDITVTLKDGRDFKAKLVGADPDTDIALLKIPARAPAPAAAGRLRRRPRWAISWSRWATRSGWARR